MASKVREGMMVRSADGAKLGRVALIGERDFQIEKGIFFPREYVASFADVAEIRGEEVILQVDKSSFKRGSTPSADGAWEDESLDRRLSGAGATTTAVVRETILIEHEHGVSPDGDDEFREEGVGVEQEGEVRAFRGRDVSVSKTHRQVEVRYSASDDGPDGFRRQTRRNEEGEE